MRDGRDVLIRRLTLTDAPALAAALTQADPWDLRKRFLGAPPPLRVLVERLEHADGVHHLGLGAFTTDGSLVGVAQFDRNDDGPSAEIAVEVATDWQRQGLGTALITSLAQRALDCGVTRFTATYYADNLAITDLVRAAPCAVVTRTEGGQGYAELDLTSPRYRGRP